MICSPSISRPGIDLLRLGWPGPGPPGGFGGSSVPSTWTVRGPVTRPRPRTIAIPSFFRQARGPFTFLVTMSSRLATVAE